jgi:hypothetical protein
MFKGLSFHGRHDERIQSTRTLVDISLSSKLSHPFIRGFRLELGTHGTVQRQFVVQGLTPPFLPPAKVKMSRRAADTSTPRSRCLKPVLGKRARDWSASPSSCRASVKCRRQLFLMLCTRFLMLCTRPNAFLRGSSDGSLMMKGSHRSVV